MQGVEARVDPNRVVRSTISFAGVRKAGEAVHRPAAKKPWRGPLPPWQVMLVITLGDALEKAKVRNSKPQRRQFAEPTSSSSSSAAATRCDSRLDSNFERSHRVGPKFDGLPPPHTAAAINSSPDDSGSDELLLCFARKSAKRVVGWTRSC